MAAGADHRLRDALEHHPAHQEAGHLGKGVYLWCGHRLISVEWRGEVISGERM